MHAPLRSFPVLETRHLLLREIVSADAPDLLRLLSDPDVVRYYDMRLMQSLSEVHAMIARHQYRFEHDEGIRWGIALKQQPRTVIGTCGLFWEWHKQRGELSYALAKPFWSRGLMTEALSTAIPYVLDSWDFIERLEAFIVDANIGSQHVLQKLGFRKEFYSRTRIFVDNQFHNEHLYVLHRSDSGKITHRWT